jgi:hypothetical protein
MWASWADETGRLFSESVPEWETILALLHYEGSDCPPDFMEPNELIPFLALGLIGFGGWMLIRAVRGRHWTLKVFGRTLGILFLFASTGLLVIYSCSEANDHRFLYRSGSVVSPDGKYSVKVIQRGREDYGTTVEIRSRWHIYPQVVFSSDDDPHLVSVQWSGAKRLIVNVPDLTGDWRRDCANSTRDVAVSCVSYGPVR